MLHVFGADALDAKVRSGARPEKKLQAQMLAEMSAIDEPRARTTMAAWAQFVQLASRTRAEPFETLEEFLPSRAIDAGELYVPAHASPPITRVPHAMLCNRYATHPTAGAHPHTRPTPCIVCPY